MTAIMVWWIGSRADLRRRMQAQNKELERQRAKFLGVEDDRQEPNG